MNVTKYATQQPWYGRGISEAYEQNGHVGPEGELETLFVQRHLSARPGIAPRRFSVLPYQRGSNQPKVGPMYALGPKIRTLGPKVSVAYILGDLR